MVLVSTAGFILSTLPQFQEDGEYSALSAIFTVIDDIAILFFTFEYGIRLLCAPRKLRFILRQVYTQFSAPISNFLENECNEFSPYF